MNELIIEMNKFVTEVRIINIIRFAFEIFLCLFIIFQAVRYTNKLKKKNRVLDYLKFIITKWKGEAKYNQHGACNCVYCSKLYNLPDEIDKHSYLKGE